MVPSVSIIVTTYNIRSYIAECLDCIVGQTLKNIEIIVVDDGSTDGTQSIIDSYAVSDSRIKPIYIKQNTPGGVASAANVGLNAASGRYIGFADGDDIYDREMFEKLYISAELHDSDIAICNFMEFDTDTGVREPAHEESWSRIACHNVNDLSTPDQKLDTIRLLPVPWRKLYRRSLIEENRIRFFECPYFFEDNYFHWLVVLASDTVSVVDEVLCYHRRNRVGQTMMSGGEKLLGVFYQHELIFSHVTNGQNRSVYKTVSLGWLIGHIAWVCQVISRNHGDEFYRKARFELRKYSKEEVRTYLQSYNYDRMTTELVVWLLSDDKIQFRRALDGIYSTGFFQKIRFNFTRLGGWKFVGTSVVYIKNLIFRRISERRIFSNADKIERLVINTNHSIDDLNGKLQQTIDSIDSLHSRINDLEHILEIGLTINDAKLRKLAPNLDQNREINTDWG